MKCGRICTSFLGVILVISLAVPTGASAKKLPPITGKLSKPGYTVIAVNYNGKAKAVEARSGKFKLRPPGKRVTLHLRGTDGIYAGPIVLGKQKKGKQALLGVKAGARLGKVKIKVRRGYAKTAKKPAKRRLDLERTARAKKGVPIGTRKFGRVRVKKLSGPSSDRDLDGIPNTFDVDDNGNLVLDNVDLTSARRSRALTSQADSGISALHSYLKLDLAIEETANVNAGSTDAEIAAALPAKGWIAWSFALGDSVELDCGGAPDPNSPTGWSGGLSWCTKGGTGTVQGGDEGPLAGQPFPECCDPDGDGYGTMVNNLNNPEAGGAGKPGAGFFLSPHATSDQIGTGDTLIGRVTSGGVEREVVNTLPYSVATVPALVSYDDGQGNSATVSYRPNPGLGGPGTRNNPFPVKADPSTGQVTVSLTFWRPQRRPIPGEAGYSEPPSTWIDIGRLNYMAQIEFTGAICPQSAFLSHSSKLDTPPSPGIPAGFKDLADDQPASPANTFAYTLDLTSCATSPIYGDGSPAPPYSFAPGDTRSFTLQYTTPSPEGSVGGGQMIWFKRVS